MFKLHQTVWYTPREARNQWQRGFLSHECVIVEIDGHIARIVGRETQNSYPWSGLFCDVKDLSDANPRIMYAKFIWAVR